MTKREKLIRHLEDVGIKEVLNQQVAVIEKKLLEMPDTEELIKVIPEFFEAFRKKLFEFVVDFWDKELSEEEIDELDALFRSTSIIPFDRPVFARMRTIHEKMVPALDKYMQELLQACQRRIEEFLPKRRSNR